MKMDNEFSDKELVDWIKLTMVKSGLGPSRIQMLIRYFGSPNGIFEASKSDLLTIKGINEKIVDGIERLKKARDDEFYNLINKCKSEAIKIIPLISKLYPEALKNISSPPANTLYAW